MYKPQIQAFRDEERNYTRKLLLFRDALSYPLLQIVEEPHLHAFLSCVEQLSTIHKRFLRVLQNECSSIMDIIKQLKVFQSLFMFYGDYFRNYWCSVTILRELHETEQLLEQVGNEMGLKESFHALSIEPIKRLSRYRIQIIEFKSLLTKAEQQEADEVAQSLRKLMDSLERMLQPVECKDIGHEEVILSNEELVKQGRVRLNDRYHVERQLMLVEDRLLLIHTTLLGPLVEAVEKLDQKSTVRMDLGTAFVVNEQLWVHAESTREQESWISIIQDCISIQRGLANDIAEPVLPLWVPDEHVDVCMRCFEPFGIFRRKHHCRGCGFVVCKSCAFQYRRLTGKQSVRVCNSCVMEIDSGNGTPWIRTPHLERSSQTDFAVRSIDGSGGQVVMEFVMSERSYVRRLILLIEVFVAPLKRKVQEFGMSGNTLVFLNNVGQIYTLNCELLQDLEYSIMQDEKEESVGKLIGSLFLNYGPLFQLYDQFAKYHQAALEEMRGSSQIREFIIQQQRHEASRLQGQSLDSLLILPIQRIPRYGLLLDSLREEYIDQEDLGWVEKAFDIVVDSLNHINEAVEYHKHYEMLKKLETTFSQSYNLAKPWRKIVFDGEVEIAVITSEDFRRRKLLVLSDTLLECRPSFQGYQVVRELPIVDLIIVDNFSDSCTVGISGEIKIRFKTIQDKKSWICLLRSASDNYEVHVKARQDSFELSKKDKVLQRSLGEFQRTLISARDPSFDTARCFKPFLASNLDESMRAIEVKNKTQLQGPSIQDPLYLELRRVLQNRNDV